MPVVTEADIIGEGQFGYVDIAGNYALRTFKHEQETFELGGQAYQDLRQLVEQVLKNKALRCAVSTKFVEEAIFNWCRDRFRGEAPERLSIRLLALVNEAVQPLVLWYPISNLEVQAAHSIGPVRIETITSEMIDAVQGTMLSQAPPEARESVDAY
ncbi:MAG TPA: hypothetical protein VFX95_09250, partial [Caulobacteraceae bacterium]|nr:hypothetical protein [Caulobacteraceae bacterium]